jgi:outer membrane protein assembly factor BamB
MHSSTTYAIFWEPPTLQDGTPTQVSSTYNGYIGQYFQDVGGSNLYSLLTQYGDTNGLIQNSSSFGGSWVDTSAYPASACSDAATPHGCLSDAQIQAEVTKAMAANNWPGGLTNLFFVFTSLGEGSCLPGGNCAFSGGTQPYCAYHSSFSNGSVLYANMPYAGTALNICGAPSSPNVDAAADSTINLVSHEQFGAVTDPLGNGWFDPGGKEISDKCAWHFGPLTTQRSANVFWNIHFYILQQEWSNRTTSCMVTGPGKQIRGIAYVGDNDGSLRAFAMGTGLELWTFQTGNDIEATPVLVNGILYVGSWDHNVYAVRANTGTLVWKYQTGDRVGETAAVVNGVVYIGSNDGSLYALDASNGSLIWSTPVNANANSSPVVANGAVFIGGTDAKVYALNTSNGSSLWSFQTTGSGPTPLATPAVDSGTVYIGASDGSFYALDASNGSSLWNFFYSLEGLNQPLVSNGVVYFTGQGGKVFAVQASTGSILWSFATFGVLFFGLSLVNGILYFDATIPHSVYALHASDGSLAWQSQTGGENWTSPLVMNGTVFMGSDDFYFYAFNASDGAFAWSCPLNIEVDSSATGTPSGG